MFNLGSIFVHSPFKPLREHMEKVTESVSPLPDFFSALHEGDEETMHELKEVVFKAEEAADQIKNDIRNHLPHRLFMPIDRRDLLAVLDMQDSVADTAQDIVSLLELRKMILPETMQDDLVEYIRLNEKVCVKARDVSGEFETLVEGGFGQNQAEKMYKLIEEVGNIETQTDDLGVALSKKLFQHEDKMKPVDVMFWYQIFQEIGDLADYAEKMCNRLRLLIAK